MLGRVWELQRDLLRSASRALHTVINMLLYWLHAMREKIVVPATTTATAHYKKLFGPKVHRGHVVVGQEFKKVCAWLDARFGPAYGKLERDFDAQVATLSKFQVAAAAVVLTVLVLVVWQWLTTKRQRGTGISVKQRMLTSLKGLPVVRSLVQKEMGKVVASMKEDVRKMESSAPVLKELPEEGVDAADMLAELTVRAEMDFRFVDGRSKATGSIYMAGDEHREILNDVYCMFSQSNPLHADMFPSVRRMEAEVVQMVASFLGGGPKGNPEVCGAMTSGGSESIITAMFASLAHQRKTRGIAQPEILIADSAHAAYYKAASYAGARLRTVRVSTRTFRLTAADVRRQLTRDTAVVVVSAVTYPHGILDDVAGIAALCRRRGVLLHVDACLGGFVLPFMRDLGYAVPPFDFAVAGVTSMSVDTHKYGLGHKGTSVVLYSSRELRRAQYTSITEWSGGLYISPGLAGSRFCERTTMEAAIPLSCWEPLVSGALIATAWAAIRHMGRAGYVQATQEIMDAANTFRECVASIPELQVCGDPAMCNIAFMSASPKFDVLQLNDLLTARKWHFAVLIKPPALHFCFTHQHAGVATELCQDLRECCEELRSCKAGSVPGKAKLYGMASSLPDRQGLADLVVEYQDIMLSA